MLRDEVLAEICQRVIGLFFEAWFDANATFSCGQAIVTATPMHALQYENSFATPMVLLKYNTE
jgi:hypothetical protein